MLPPAMILSQRFRFRVRQLRATHNDFESARWGADNSTPANAGSGIGSLWHHRRLRVLGVLDQQGPIMVKIAFVKIRQCDKTIQIVDRHFAMLKRHQTVVPQLAQHTIDVHRA